jgi:hypothetical protein
MCALFRNGARYLAEWIEFHMLVGAERFFLYDNESEDDPLDVLAPYLEEGVAVLHEWPGSATDSYFALNLLQVSAYEHCISTHGAEARWLAIIDTDEFLFSPTGHTLPEVLRGYEQHPGVGVSRAWMGTSGHETRPEGLLLANFSTRLYLPEPNRSVKSIVDPSRVAHRVNEHWFEYKDGTPTVDEHHQPLPSWTRPELTFDVLRINHYFSKSEQEALAKFDRPQAGGGQLRPELKLKALRRRNVQYARPDHVIQQYLPALEKQLEAVSYR